MRFHVSYYKVAIFFAGITMTLITESHSKAHSRIFTPPLTDQEYTSNSLDTTPSSEAMPTSSKDILVQHRSTFPQQLLTSPQNQAECGPLKQGNITGELVDILCPEMFSHADPFRYLIDKTMKIPYRSISWVSPSLNELLRTGQIPHCYLPYAKALLSLLRCWPDFFRVDQDIRQIQKTYPSNDVDFSLLPSDFSSSPQLLELFSSDIFSDPTPPLRIFYKLLNMPKSDMPNLKAQLQNLVNRYRKDPKNIPIHRRNYIWYATDVWYLLQNESIFDNLKRNMAEIQKITTSD